MRRHNFVFICFRLHGAMVTNRKRSLVNQGQSEAKLLHTYGVELPRTNGVSYEIDQTSVNILNMYQPVMNVAYEPLHIIGDGSCLYRAASSVLSGHQSNHLLLRLMTAFELIKNISSYDTKKPYNDVLHDCRVGTSDYDQIVRELLQWNGSCVCVECRQTRTYPVLLSTSVATRTVFCIR